MNNKFIFVLLFLLPVSLVAMDQPPSRKSKASGEQEKKQTKRAAYGSKQFGELSDIKIIPQSSNISDWQQKLDYVKAQVSVLLTGQFISPEEYQNIYNFLHELKMYSNNPQIKAEAYLLLGHMYLYGWGQPQNIKEANRSYNAAIELAIPLKDDVVYFKNISQLLLDIKDILNKKNLPVSQKLQEVKDKVKNSHFKADALTNKLILDLIKKIYPESNVIENALDLGSLGALAVIQRLILTNTEYHKEAMTLITNALFANNQPLLNKIYQNITHFKDLMDGQWLEIAIRNSKLDDLAMFLKAGVNKQYALSIAEKYAKVNAINMIKSEINLTQTNVEPLAKSSLLEPIIPINTQLMIAVKQSNIPKIETLLLAGANINHIDEISNTPLIEAIQNKNAHLVKWLLDHGADPLLVIYDDGNLRVTADYAARLEENADEEIIKIIEDHLVSKLKVLSSPAKPAAAPSTTPKVIPIRSFDEL